MNEYYFNGLRAETEDVGMVLFVTNSIEQAVMWENMIGKKAFRVNLESMRNDGFHIDLMGDGKTLLVQADDIPEKYIIGMIN